MKGDLKKGFEESSFCLNKDLPQSVFNAIKLFFAEKNTHKDAHHSLVFQASLIFVVKVKTYPSGASSYFPGDIVNFFSNF